MNAGEGEVMLHCAPETDEPVVSKLETPPVPKPLASDMVITNCFPEVSAKGGVENDPFCVAALNEEDGIEML